MLIRTTTGKLLAAAAVTALALPTVHSQDMRTPEEALATFAEDAEKARLKAADMSFEQFKATVSKESIDNGKYIVDGDTPISDEKGLREYYEQNVLKRPTSAAKFAVHVRGGVDAVWSQAQKRALTYCVSDNFSATRYALVVADMQRATEAWENSADLDFIHLSEHDSDCDAFNSNVVFDVNPVSGQDYLARAFFPGDSRVKRNVLIDESSFGLDPTQNLTLTGILRHELGHAIGARHEHTRPESGACFEDSDVRPITSYDPFSVMHYPQCNGMGDWKLQLTDIDKSGVACLYGASPWFVIDDEICTDELTELKSAQSVTADAFEIAGEYQVVPGSSFRVFMRGGTSAGDPDVYVRFGGVPTKSDWDCRPYTIGAEESCDLTVPDGVTEAHVAIHGYASDASYDLWVANRF